MDCKTCKENRQEVSYIVYESAMARAERHVRRLVIAVVTAIIALLLTNAIWLYAWMQYDYTGENTVVEARFGTANYIGNDGDIYGENNS